MPSRAVAALLAVGFALGCASGDKKAPAKADEKPATTPEAPAKAATLPQADPVMKDERVRSGIKVELAVAPAEVKGDGKKLLAETDAVLTVKLTDTTTGLPISGAYPAAWLSRRKGKDVPDQKLCTDMVEAFVAGGIFYQADVNMNEFTVLVMNDDATINVVDPQFGFGGTKLITMVTLPGPGYDWALTEDQDWLFVSVPKSSELVKVETTTYKVVGTVNAGPSLGRLALQPDGEYVWVRSGDGKDGALVAVDAKTLVVKARVPTGGVVRDLAFSDNSRYVFAAVADQGLTAVIDTRTLKKVANLATGDEPISVDWSPEAKAAYVAHRRSGTIAVIDPQRMTVAATIQSQPGLTELRFSPKGRYALLTNSARNTAHVVDAASNRIIQSGGMDPGPDQIAYSRDLGYIRQSGSDQVFMVSLDQLGAEGKPLSVTDLPAGQQHFGPPSSPARSIVQAPGQSAVLVAHPRDANIYYYKEGMAAPMGNFANYRKAARAVLVVDRSLRETVPGTYRTVTRLPAAAQYDIAFFMDAPRTVECFGLKIDENPALAGKEGGRPLVEPKVPAPIVPHGKKAKVAFQLRDPGTKEPITGVKDVRVITMLSPGVWQRRHWATESTSVPGLYEVEFVPPKAGAYYIYVEARSKDLPAANNGFAMLQAH